MRTLFFVSLVISSLAPLSASPKAWNLIWSDEFTIDGPVDTSRWFFETGTGSNGWGNNELEFYTNRQENATVHSGNLEITVRRQDTAGMRFTSARMTTGWGRFSFQYGKVEARIKVLKGKGMWPAFWMMGKSIASTPWPGCGEIDIMEVMNRGGPLDDNIVLSTAHWLNDANNSHAQYGLSDTSATPLADSFHVYSTTWDPHYIRSFIDGRQFWEIDITPDGLSEFHQPFYLLLNAAVGGTPLNITNPSAITATLPQTMLVDYVRVYQEATGTERGSINRRGIESLSVNFNHAGTEVSLRLTQSQWPSDPDVSIYTVNGKCIARQQLSYCPGTARVEVPVRLSQGVYLLVMKTRTGCLRKLFSVSSTALSK